MTDNFNGPVNVVCSGSNSGCVVKLEQVFCDGFYEHGRIGVFSHFHQDHIKSIEDCIGTYDKIIVHPITFAAITALKPGLKYREQWLTQGYDDDGRGARYPFKGGTIRLLDANHIPGSAQVHVETENYSLLYSGDFNFPGMQIRRADYLVLDATHGSMEYDAKTDRQSVMNRLFEDVKEQIDNNHPVVIVCPSGTLQEIIKNFEIGHNEHISHDIPFVADEKQIKVLENIYEQYKSDFREFVEFDSREFWKLHRHNKKMVIFLTHEPIPSELTNYYKIIVERYRFTEDQPAIRQFSSGKGCRYNLESHATIENIYSYVKEVDPKVVITDRSRSYYAPRLAKLIEQHFEGKIKCYTRP